MGDPKFPRRKYQTPSHPWQADRIKWEKELVKKYGLVNKKEVWRAQSMLRSFRRQARQLMARMRLKDPQAQIESRDLIRKLIKLGLLEEGATLDDILGLDIEAVLQRRLQSIVYRKGLANTIKQARQFIVHGHIAVGDRRVTIPGYMVKRDEEDTITYWKYSKLADELHPMRPKVETAEIPGEPPTMVSQKISLEPSEAEEESEMPE